MVTSNITQSKSSLFQNIKKQINKQGNCNKINGNEQEMHPLTCSRQKSQHLSQIGFFQ
jgi:hypothetical protein